MLGIVFFLYSLGVNIAVNLMCSTYINLKYYFAYPVQSENARVE